MSLTKTECQEKWNDVVSDDDVVTMGAELQSIIEDGLKAFIDNLNAEDFNPEWRECIIDGLDSVDEATGETGQEELFRLLVSVW